MLGEERMMFGGGRVLRVLLGWRVWVCVTTGHRVVPVAACNGKPVGIGQAWSGDADSPRAQGWAGMWWDAFVSPQGWQQGCPQSGRDSGMALSHAMAPASKFAGVEMATALISK